MIFLVDKECLVNYIACIRPTTPGKNIGIISFLRKGRKCVIAKGPTNGPNCGVAVAVGGSLLLNQLGSLDLLRSNRP